MFLTYSSEHDHSFIDRALYLPKEWREDKQCRVQTEVSETAQYAKTAELARTFLQRAFEAQVPHRWITADSIYGHDRQLRECYKSAKHGM